MFDLDNNYWLFISPHVYCCIKDKQALLYNTKNNEYLETQDNEIISLLGRLHEKENLGSIYCRGEFLMQSCYADFVAVFSAKGMGGVVDIVKVPEKPIIMMPLLNLQCDADRLKLINDREIGENALLYLSELNIYLNNSCGHCCLFCNNYCLQYLCCYTGDNKTSQTLDLSVLKDLLLQLRMGVVGKLNLLGGNLFKYPYYEELYSLLPLFKGKIHFWNHYADFIDCRTLITDFIYNVIVLFPVNERVLKSSLLLLSNFQTKVHFYVTQIEECNLAEELIVYCGIGNYMIHPVYVENNHTFFEKYVYLEKIDILQSHLSFDHIFMHQKMNSNFFGSLTVLANGDVCTSLNMDSLGNVFEDALIEIIAKEMYANTAWRKIRNSPPCSDCLYQYLCPSPSNQELVIGKPNLCHVAIEMK